LALAALIGECRFYYGKTAFGRQKGRQANLEKKTETRKPLVLQFGWVAEWTKAVVLKARIGVPAFRETTRKQGSVNFKTHQNRPILTPAGVTDARSKVGQASLTPVAEGGSSRNCEIHSRAAATCSPSISSISTR
jgi:hypothetical protein